MKVLAWILLTLIAFLALPIVLVGGSVLRHGIRRASTQSNEMAELAEVGMSPADEEWIATFLANNRAEL